MSVLLLLPVVVATALTSLFLSLLLLLLLPLVNAQVITFWTTETTTPRCDSTLWSHVYHPQRLQIVDRCRSVTGVVTVVRPEADGDYHIALNPDAKYVGLVNAANIKLQKGNLVIEPICSHKPITQPSAINACTNFQQHLLIPSVGQHIAVTGSYVLDHDHSNWAEIHPITTLKIN